MDSVSRYVPWSRFIFSPSLPLTSILMLMPAALLTPQCVNHVWWNAPSPECSNTSFSALIKFFGVRLKRLPVEVSSGGTSIPSFPSPTLDFYFFPFFLFFHAEVSMVAHPAAHQSSMPSVWFLAGSLEENKTSTSRVPLLQRHHVGLITQHLSLALPFTLICHRGSSQIVSSLHLPGPSQS